MKLSMTKDMYDLLVEKEICVEPFSEMVSEIMKELLKEEPLIVYDGQECVYDIEITRRVRGKK